MSREEGEKLNPTRDHIESPESNRSQAGAGIKKGFIFSLLITISLGTFQFGYSIGVFNTLQVPFSAKFNWTEYQYYPANNTYIVDPDHNNANFWVASITTVCSIGAAISALFAGPLAKYGKWKMILFTNVFIFLGSAICLIPNQYAILVGRFISGLAGGSFSVFVPLYINETAPIELKGPLGVMTQLFITVGIMVSMIIGLPIPTNPITTFQNNQTIDEDARKFIPAETYDAYNEWRETWEVNYYYIIMFGLPLFIGVLQVLLLIIVFPYETPKVLKQRGQMAKLSKLMGKIYHFSQVEDKILAIPVDEGTKENDGQSNSPTYGQSLCHPKYRMASFVGIILSAFQQFSGINAVMFYSSAIFSKLQGITPNTGTALVGVVNMLSTLASSLLLSYFGRKTLLWTLSFLMSASLIGLGVAYNANITSLEVTLVLVFVALFEFSIGPILWIYMSETMTDKAVSLGTVANWVVTIFIALLVPTLLDKWGGYLFIVFGGFCALCGFFSLFVVKETKGLTNQQVAILYSKDKADLIQKEKLQRSNDLDETQ